MYSLPATVFTELDLEWEHLLASRQLDRAFAQWRATDDVLDDFTDVGEVLSLLSDQDGDPERQSEVLLALLRQAPDEPLAARLVLQRFIAPLRTIAGWKQPLRQVDWAALIVSAAFEVIVTYPVERRPDRVAANIVWDVRKRMYAELSQYRCWQDEISEDDPAECVQTVEHAPGVEAAELLRWAAHRSRLPRDVAEVIVLTRAVGFQLKEVAENAGVSSGALRQRRWRSEQRLRDVIAAAS